MRLRNVKDTINVIVQLDFGLLEVNFCRMCQVIQRLCCVFDFFKISDYWWFGSIITCQWGLGCLDFKCQNCLQKEFLYFRFRFTSLTHLYSLGRITLVHNKSEPARLFGIPVTVQDVLFRELRTQVSLPQVPRLIVFYTIITFNQWDYLVKGGITLCSVHV